MAHVYVIDGVKGGRKKIITYMLYVYIYIYIYVYIYIYICMSD